MYFLFIAYFKSTILQIIMYSRLTIYSSVPYYFTYIGIGGFFEFTLRWENYKNHIVVRSEDCCGHVLIQLLIMSRISSYNARPVAFERVT